MRHTQDIHRAFSRAIFDHPSRRGQGVLEFVLVSSSVLFFIFLFINLCYVFLVTQYVDYAVFMSARSLSAAHRSDDVQRVFAQKTLNRMLGLEAGGVFGPLVRFITPAEQAVLAVAKYPNPKTGGSTVAGVRMEYDVPVFLIPPFGILRGQDVERLMRMRLVAETYLDREPSQEECLDYFDRFLLKHFSYLTTAQREAISREASDDGC